METKHFVPNVQFNNAGFQVGRQDFWAQVDLENGPDGLIVNAGGLLEAGGFTGGFNLMLTVGIRYGSKPALMILQSRAATSIPAPETFLVDWTLSGALVTAFALEGK